MVLDGIEPGFGEFPVNTTSDTKDDALPARVLVVEDESIVSLDLSE